MYETRSIPRASKKRGTFERWLDRHNHKMELARTVGSLVAGIGTVVLLLKAFGVI